MAEPTTVSVKRTVPFKATKKGVEFPLRMIFGFLPERIVIQKVPGGRLILNAVMTKAELEREAKEETISQAANDVKQKNTNQKEPVVSGRENT